MFLAALCVGIPWMVFAQHPGYYDTNFDSNPGANSNVWAFAVQPDGKILIGGEFWEVQGYVRPYVARLDSDGSLDLSFYVSVDGPVSKIIVQPDGKILISGYFTLVDGQQVTRIARLNTNGTIDTSFDVGDGPNGVVYDMALCSNGQIIVGGFFSAFNAYPKSYLARIFSDGSLDTSYPSGAAPDGYVFRLQHDSQESLYVSGGFSSIAGYSRPGLARLLPDGSIYSSFYPFNIDGLVRCFALDPASGGIFVGGYFTNICGSAYNRIALLTLSGDINASFNPGSGFNGSVDEVVVQKNGRPIAVGTFTAYNGNNAHYLARLHTDGTLDTQYSYPLGAPGNWLNAAYLLPSGKLLAGGVLTNFSIYPAGGYCRIMGERTMPNDFDGDGLSDVAVYYATAGDWYIRQSSDASLMGGGAVNWGWMTAVPALADYDTDGKTDICVFDPSTGTWYLRPSSDPMQAVFTNFGGVGGIPVPGDYDGDRIVEFAVYTPQTGTWLKHRYDGVETTLNWGWPDAIPVPADYDGDGTLDVAVYHPATGNWYLKKSSEGVEIINWGWGDAQPVQDDYDGDGKADLAVYHAETGNWYIRYYTSESEVVTMGGSGSIPVPGLYRLYEGASIQTYQMLTGTWFTLPGWQTLPWGWNGAFPVNQQFWINDRFGFWSKG